MSLFISQMNTLFSKNFITWYFLLPVLIIHFLVIIFPSLSSLILCFTDWNGFGKINFVGLENFKELFVSSIISTSLSLKTSNDETKPHDYEFMIQTEKQTDNYSYYINFRLFFRICWPVNPMAKPGTAQSHTCASAP